MDAYLQGLDRDSEEFSRLPMDKPLLGVPFTVKNNLNVCGYTTMTGNPAFDPTPAAADTHAVHQLREAGAIPLALTLVAGGNTSHPPTRHPYDVRRTPGGSSSGEGALIGAAASIFGLGNDSGGSVRNPAGFCGCFGLKPTAGIVSLKGLIPEVTPGSAMAELWCIGPLCRYAEDLPTILRCILSDSRLADTKLRLNEPVDVSQLRLFYMREFEGAIACEPVEAAVKENISRVAEYFQQTHDVRAHRVKLPLGRWAPSMWLASAHSEDPQPNDSLAKARVNRIVSCVRNL